MAFGCKPGDENYNEIADMDKNEEINILDISIVALDYGLLKISINLRCIALFG